MTLEVPGCPWWGGGRCRANAAARVSLSLLSGEALAGLGGGHQGRELCLEWLLPVAVASQVPGSRRQEAGLRPRPPRLACI